MWAPGVPLYLDPDVREDRGEEDVQYAREMWEVIEEPWENGLDPDDELWACDSRSFRWEPSGEAPTWPWQAPIAKRRTKPGKRW